MKRIAAGVITWLPMLESAWVCVSRHYPNVRLIRSFSCAISESLLRKNDRSRRVTLQSGPIMVLDPSDLLSEVYFFGTYESDITEIVLRSVRPGDVVFDVGANAGYYTLLMAGIVGESGRVHAFEPNSNILLMLQQSVVLNGYEKRVSVNNVAIGAHDQEYVEFFLSQLPQNTGISSIKPHEWGLKSNAYSTTPISVKSTTLDEYVRVQGVSRCDLIKIDVEGTEECVVIGMESVLRKLHPAMIICETSVNGMADKVLRNAGYKRHVTKGCELCEVVEPSYWGNLVYTS